MKAYVQFDERALREISAAWIDADAKPITGAMVELSTERVEGATV